MVLDVADVPDIAGVMVNPVKGCPSPPAPDGGPGERDANPDGEHQIYRSSSKWRHFDENLDFDQNFI